MSLYEDTRNDVDERIIEMAMQGRTLSWVSQTLGIPLQTVSDRARKLGAVFAGNKAKPTMEARKTLARRALAEGRTIAESASIAGMHRNAVSPIARAMGISTRRQSSFSPEAYERAKALYLSGLSLRQVAQKTGLYHQTLSRNLKKDGVTIRNTPIQWTSEMKAYLKSCRDQKGYGTKVAQRFGITRKQVTDHIRNLKRSTKVRK